MNLTQEKRIKRIIECLSIKAYVDREEQFSNAIVDAIYNEAD